MSTKKQQVETITIAFHGDKRFCQEVIDRVYKTLMDEDFQVKASRPRCGLDLESSIYPSDDVMW